jgi:hypothetical protein
MEHGPIEDKQLKSRHFAGTVGLKDLWHGRQVWVHAWWTTSDDPVPCEIVAVHPSQDIEKSPRPVGKDLTVRPLCGNTHARAIDIRNIAY